MSDTQTDPSQQYTRLPRTQSHPLTQSCRVLNKQPSTPDPHLQALWSSSCLRFSSPATPQSSTQASVSITPLSPLWSWSPTTPRCQVCGHSLPSQQTPPAGPTSRDGLPSWVSSPCTGSSLCLGCYFPLFHVGCRVQAQSSQASSSLHLPFLPPSSHPDSDLKCHLYAAESHFSLSCPDLFPSSRFLHPRAMAKQKH